jgi:hypothetical protein
MELLCLKSNGQFLRILNGSYQLTSMTKASVYPVAESDMVRTLYFRFKKELEELHIIKLTIVEEEIDPEERI